MVGSGYGLCGWVWYNRGAKAWGWGGGGVRVVGVGCDGCSVMGWAGVGYGRVGSRDGAGWVLSVVFEVGY